MRGWASRTARSAGAPIARQSPQQIVDRVLELEEGTRFQVLAPVVRSRKGEYTELLRELQAKGYSRARVDGTVIRLDSATTGTLPALKKYEKHDIEVVVDRLDVKQSARRRLTDSVETALGPVRRHRRARFRGPAGDRPAPGADVLRAPGLPLRRPVLR